MTVALVIAYVAILILLLGLVKIQSNLDKVIKGRPLPKDIPSLVTKPLCSICHGPVGETPTEVYMEIPMPPDGKILPVTLKVCEKH